MITVYITSFLLGLFSAIHCVAMCGSIIGALTFSLPEHIRNSQRRMLPFVLSYNFGRIISYTMAGAIVGLLSSPLAAINGHLILSLVSAVVMISMGLYLAGWFPRFAMMERMGVPIWKKLQPIGQKLLPIKSLPNAWLLGMVWGWLPCGLVYAALTVALPSGSALNGSLIMLSFGLGTLPATIATSLFSGLLIRKTQVKSFRKFAGGLIILMGVVTLITSISMNFSDSHNHHMMDMPNTSVYKHG